VEAVTHLRGIISRNHYRSPFKFCLTNGLWVRHSNVMIRTTFEFSRLRPREDLQEKGNNITSAVKDM
jgi:hypothetical protein